MKAVYQLAYIAWKSDCKVYKRRKEGQKIVKLIDSTQQKDCANRIRKLLLADFLLLDDAKLTMISDKYSSATVVYYATCLEALYMRRKKSRHRY